LWSRAFPSLQNAPKRLARPAKRHYTFARRAKRVARLIATAA
jgi:hypothetical protein